MNYFIIIIILAVIGFFTGKLIKHKSLYPFLPFRYDFRRRRDMFRRCLKILDLTNAQMIVETGTSREGLAGSKSNGAATLVFGKWAKMNGAYLHSVDISKESIAESMKEVKAQGLESHVALHLSDSVAFLKDFEKKVDFLYLDSYDYSLDPEIQLKSQEHHLNEFKAIEQKLHHNSVVLIDDCDLPNGGKGKLVVEYMLNNQWKILKKEYQILLARETFFID